VTRQLSNARRDEVARDAARLLRDGRAQDIHSAVRAALRGNPGADEVTAGMVREHARGLALEELGASGYRQHVAEVLERAEETMTLLATQLGNSTSGWVGETPVALIGRAARGLVDADPVCRIRVVSDAPVGDIAAILVAAGVEEPSFSTMETRFGRLDRLTFDDAGVETKILRLPPAMRIPLHADLQSDRPTASVPAIDLVGVRRLLSALRGDVASGSA
jgi:hypothetical protein